MNIQAGISFLLMNKKGFLILRRLIDNNLHKHIIAIVAAKDSALQKDYYDEIKETCQNNNIVFFDKSDNYESALEGDYIITIGWRWLVKGKLMKKLIISHDSILPKYRGFSPLVNMLINGEKTIGVSFLRPGDIYDSGALIIQKTTKIKYPMKIGSAIKIISDLFYDGIKEIIETLVQGNELPFLEQTEANATYSLWRNEEDYFIDFNQSAKQISRMIDAVGYPYSGACAYLNDVKIRVLDVENIDDLVIENRDVGKVIFVKDGIPTVVCGSGLLRFVKIMDDNLNTSILPLNKFRSKFKGLIN